ncbi:UvrD-helicase domain-containing protein [Methylomagnum ishizawai]|uniref:UvrD-helicase domain-containing protein n=1 Tax=Methylomagnum ishizawai TaxID=1760988 RepID=UPI001C32CB68|nr:UvrD-helicase domain-containing protein [Methylomagnum ishizawai]BBL73698.1 DNA helicase [Methylomagnum ishizawai]
MKMRRILQPDTHADLTLKDILVAPEKKSFVMVAGAGSGKTTSLVKSLASIVTAHGAKLTKHRQRIACITYTEIAASEIWADVSNNPLIYVSTIHSFLWMLVRTFQNDLKQWVEDRVDEKLLELRNEAANYGLRVQQKTREKNLREIDRYEVVKHQIKTVRTFNYSTGSNYSKGLLGHDDVLRVGTQLLTERPLLRMLLSQQFPFLFVDESQDTTAGVVEALKAVELQMRERFCLGFFGDPMQRIYMTGVGDIKPEDGWLSIPKHENFRCPTRVLNVANAIRNRCDDLVQTRGRMITVNGQQQAVKGSAHIFVLPSDHNRDEYLRLVRKWISIKNNDPIWTEDDANKSVKILVIVHRMAAVRLGFCNLYSAMNDKAPESFKSGFLDGTAWPLRPFISFVIPLSNAVKRNDEFAAISLLRLHCPLLAKEALQGKNLAQLLLGLRNSTFKIEGMLRADSGATNRDVLNFLRDNELLILDQRLLPYLDESLPLGEVQGESDHEVETSKEMAAMEVFLNCQASEFWGYKYYVDNLSPFSTQQGIKGAEFERVMVILDDEEGTHSQFSYDKYLGIKELSKIDQKNIDDGKETVIDRTGRLFYVCCTRALTDLAVVLFSSTPEKALTCVQNMSIFPQEDILILKDITSLS